MPNLKIFVFTLPASGHVNPILPLLRELKNVYNAEIIVYLTEEFRSKFETAGCEVRVLNNFDIISKVDIKPLGDKRHFEMLAIQRTLIEAIYSNLDNIVKEIDKEKPDLIIHDTCAVHAKWIFRYYKKWFDRAQETNEPKRSRLKLCPTWPLPPVMAFSAVFVVNEHVYPNKIEWSLLIPFSYQTIRDLIKLFISGVKISLKCGLKFASAINDSYMRIDDFTQLIMSPVFPELHPRSHLYDYKFYKFVGTTVEEGINPTYLSLLNQEPIKTILESIPQGNSQSFFKDPNSPILIYASLGTLFNNNLPIYQAIVDAFKTFDNEAPKYRSSVNFSNLRVVISTGQKCFDQFEELIKRKGYLLPKNIYLVSSVPQIEILKRASLFITHSGMNSTSESIHCRVPMVCIPLCDDQPLVAYRIADELGLGIRIDYTTMKYSDVRRAAHRIFNDRSFYDRTERYSTISRNYVGYSTGAKIAIDFAKSKNISSS